MSTPSQSADLHAIQAHGSEPPSDWVQRWSHLVPPGAPVLDVACGRGRHSRWFAARGHSVTAIDRDTEALATTAASHPGIQTVETDIENGPWPLPGQAFGAVVITNYLWRALTTKLIDSVAEGGIYIHETFATGHEQIGRPRRPEFLLRRGELLEMCAGKLRVVAYEDGFHHSPERFIQRIVAVRESTQDEDPAKRWPLTA